jgi:host factor-I protein
MQEDSGNLQNEFFNAVRKDRTQVAVFLSNGKRLVGRVKAFDKFTILLDGPHGEHIVFKHAISTVSHAGQEERRADEPQGRVRAAASAGDSRSSS